MDSSYQGGHGNTSNRSAAKPGLDAPGDGDSRPQQPASASSGGHRVMKVYWRRWLMLLYMSVFNLLSDWTCYSVAPIAVLTSEAFGDIDPEQLVVVFLGANAISTACEPIILSRLGLRRTVVFGALLLTMGSIIKSGGLPPVFESNLEKGKGEWRVYLGFLLVGLSQPLYQCTPALLSASWFPEKERTMATGVALNANQLGIGFAFIFGTLLVATSDDIVPYFGLLSLVSTVFFIGALFQFDDAPPTPPSDTARVISGTLEFPDAESIWRSVRNFGARIGESGRSANAAVPNLPPAAAAAAAAPDGPEGAASGGRAARPGGMNPGLTGSARRRPGTGRAANSNADRNAAASPSPGPTDAPVRMRKPANARYDMYQPSPMMPGPVHQAYDSTGNEEEGAYPEGADPMENPAAYAMHGNPPPMYSYQQPPGGMPSYPYPNVYNPNAMPPYGAPTPPQGWQHYPYYDPRYQQQPQQQQAPQHQGPYAPPPTQGFPYHMPQQPGVPPHLPQQGYYYQPNPYYAPHMFPPQYYGFYDPSQAAGPNFDEGAEPTLTVTDHHLDINIRDDQIVLSTRACFSRPGFIHALMAFTVSGIVINTLSTFMDYLVRLNGAGREYVGIVGGSFQFVIMISSLIIGKQTDRTRAYYSVTIGMLVLGAFGLAECGVSLDADRGGDLRWSLIVVALLVGPLQPVSTELGVEVAYPLSENTVLVIQQLFSNLLSALFIPFFKALRDVGTERIDATELYERPQYTFSFYLLIVLHAAVTVFFATFNGRYLRYEHELAKKAKQEQEEQAGHNQDPYPEEYDETGEPAAAAPSDFDPRRLRGVYVDHPEQQPLISNGAF